MPSLETLQSWSECISAGAVPICKRCHEMLFFCPCENVPYGTDLAFAWPDYSQEQKSTHLRSWAEKFEEKCPSVAATQFCEDFLANGLIESLERTQDRLEVMRQQYVTRETESTLHTLGFSRDVLGDWSRNAFIFLHDLNVSLMQPLHVVMIQNAFQLSDPADFDVNDDDLSRVFEFVHAIMKFNEVARIMQQQTDRRE